MTKRSYACLMFLMILLFISVSACSTAGLSKIKDGSLEMIGLGSKPETPAGGVPKSVKLQLYAGGNLNADERGRPMAVVMKFYRLRDPGAFMQASYDVLADANQEKAVLGNDILDVKEVVLIPGQEMQRMDVLSSEAGYLGVVALFRKPYPGRWRLLFSGAQPGNASGIVLGAHSCALTVSRGVPQDAQLVSAGSLGGVLCR